MPPQAFLGGEWARHRAAIDTKLEADSSRVLYVQGGHGAGNGTTLLKYVWDRSQDLRDGAPVLYLMASAVECTMFRDRFTESVCTEEEAEKVLARAGRRSWALRGHLCITSVAQWLKSVLRAVCDEDQPPILDPALRGVVLMEEGVALTEEWDLCLGVLADAVTSPGATLLLVGLGCMSRHESEYVSMLEDRGSAVETLVVRAGAWKHDSIKLIQAWAGDDAEETVLHARIRRTVDSGQNVVVFDRSYANGGLKMVAHVSHTDDMESSKLREVVTQERTGVILVRPPAMGMTTDIPNVGMVVVGPERTGMLSDPDVCHGQRAWSWRQLHRRELEAQMLAALEIGAALAFAGSPDEFGDIWDTQGQGDGAPVLPGDPLTMAVQAVALWPGRQTLPLRELHRGLLLRKALQDLATRSLATSTGAGYQLTSLGQRFLHAYCRLPWKDFAATHLVALIDPAMPADVVAALVAVSSLASFPSKLLGWSSETGASQVTVGPRVVERGSLWMALSKLQAGLLAEGDETMVMKRVRRVCKVMGVEEFDVARLALSPECLSVLDSCLMHAYADRLVAISGEKLDGNWRGRVLTTAQVVDLSRVAGVVQGWCTDASRQTGYIAIAHDFEVVERDTGPVLTTDTLTRVFPSTASRERILDTL